MKTDKRNFQQERASALIQYHDLLECYIIGACYRTWPDRDTAQSKSFDALCSDLQRSVAEYLIKLQPLKNPDSVAAKIAAQALRICTDTMPIYAAFVVTDTEKSPSDSKPLADMHDMYSKLTDPEEPVYNCPCCGKAAHVYRYSESPAARSSYVVCCSDSIDDSSTSTQPLPCVLSLPSDDFHCSTIRDAVILWNNYRNYCESSKLQATKYSE